MLATLYLKKSLKTIQLDERAYRWKASPVRERKVIYRLAGREREKSASYYTPEVLTKCLVKYALKELLEGKQLMKFAQLVSLPWAALHSNETINQLAEAYLDRNRRNLEIDLS